MIRSEIELATLDSVRGVLFKLSCQCHAFKPLLTCKTVAGTTPLFNNLHKGALTFPSLCVFGELLALFHFIVFPESSCQIRLNCKFESPCSKCFKGAFPLKVITAVESCLNT